MSNASNSNPLQIRHGDIRPRSDFGDHAVSWIDYAKGANVEVTVDDVPPRFRHLIPLVRKWAMRDCGERSLFVNYLREHDPAEIDRLCATVEPVAENLRSWFADLRATVGVSSFSTAARDFEYMMATYDLARPKDQSHIARHMNEVAERHTRLQREANIRVSADAMRDRNFAEVIRLLSPYASELAPVDARRLELALSRLTQDQSSIESKVSGTAKQHPLYGS